MIREVQARAGFDRTPIPRLTGGADTTGAIDLAGPEPAPGPATAPAVAATRGVGRHPGQRAGSPSTSADSGVTIARARPAGPPGRHGVRRRLPGPGATRRWIAIGAVAAAVAAVIVGVLVLGGDEDGASPPSTTAGAIPTDPFFEILSPPTDVAVVALGEGSFEVSYVAPEGVASVEIEYANGEYAGQIVSSNASPAVLDVRRPDALRDAPLDRPGRSGVDRRRAGVLRLTVVVAGHEAWDDAEVIADRSCP